MPASAPQGHSGQQPEALPVRACGKCGLRGAWLPAMRQKENPCGGRGRGKRENAGVLLTQINCLVTVLYQILPQIGLEDFPTIDKVKSSTTWHPSNRCDRGLCGPCYLASPCGIMDYNLLQMPNKRPLPAN